jgi:hypothetical protein
MRPGWLLKLVDGLEIDISRHGRTTRLASGCGLKDKISPDLLCYDIQTQKRVAQVVKDTHEKNKIPALLYPGKVVNLTAFEAAGAG